jgi:hypothetical protein
MLSSTAAQLDVLERFAEIPTLTLPHHAYGTTHLLALPTRSASIKTPLVIADGL